MMKIIDNFKDRQNKLNYGEILWDLDVSRYMEFKDVDDISKWGARYYNQWAEVYKKNMNIAKSVLRGSVVSAPVECYCGELYRQINEYLRFDRDNDNYNYRELANILSIALATAPRVPQDVVVYRLVCDSFIEELIDHNKRGSVVQEKGFMSTSLLSSIVNVKEIYTNEVNILKLYVNKGSIGIYVNSITKRSEQELLLYPNSFLKLLKYPYYDERLNKIVWECEVFYF